ncbi:MAG: oligoendopeptidase F [Roseiflexaceae bacterium]
MTMALPRRAEVAQAATWDLESIFASPADWEAAFAAVEAGIPGLAHFQGRLGESADTLLAWFHESEALVQLFGKVSVYARLGFDVDTTNQAQGALVGRTQSLAARLAAALAFAEPELLSIPVEDWADLLASDERLEVYVHYFDNLDRQRAHVRSAEVEELLAAIGEPFSTFYNAYGVLADGDLRYAPALDEQGNAQPVARGTVQALLQSGDRTLRKNAWAAYADGFLQVKNTMAALMAGNVRSNVFRARSRRYPSALEASLAANHVPLAVYENVLDAYQRHQPIWHRYWQIRRRALGLEKLEGCDIFAPLVEREIAVPFEQAVEWICTGMQPLGDDYVATMRQGLLEQRWVDIYPNVGKRNGAYSSGTYGTHPFILMSYTDSISSMSTLAHELGHSMHSYYSRRDQPFVYSRYTLFVAEVASNFNQALVRNYLMQQSQDRLFQIGLIEEAMQNFHRYLFIMPILALYEREVHALVERGQALTADGMSKLVADLFRAGYGSAVEVDEQRDGITWAQFQHMYMNFYVFQYASGIAGANALAVPIAAGDQTAIDNYRQFLSAGGSLYPLDALKLAGIDMSEPEPMDRAFKVLEGFVDRLDQLI